jgi:TRAP-type C4-dicarboxylate transport system permease small subunit
MSSKGIWFLLGLLAAAVFLYVASVYVFWNVLVVRAFAVESLTVSQAFVIGLGWMLFLGSARKE